MKAILSLCSVAAERDVVPWISKARQDGGPETTMLVAKLLSLGGGLKIQGRSRFG